MFNERIALADLKERVPNLDYCLWNCLETDTSSYNQSAHTFDLLRCIPSSVHRISVNPCETMTSTWTANRHDSSSESLSSLFPVTLHSDLTLSSFYPFKPLLPNFLTIVGGNKNFWIFKFTILGPFHIFFASGK